MHNYLMQMQNYDVVDDAGDEFVNLIISYEELSICKII